MSVSSPSYFGPASGAGSIIGATAGSATGARVFLAGASAGKNSTLSDLILIGQNAGAGGLTDPNHLGLTAIGSSAYGALNVSVSGGSGFVAGGTAVGYHAGQNLIHGSGNTLVGSNIYAANVTSAGSGYFNGNVAIGENIAPTYNSAGAAPVHSNVLIGAGVLGGSGNARPQQCVFIGFQVCLNATGGGDNNTIIGNAATPSLSNGSTRNVVIGASAGNSLTTGTDNVYVGAQTNLSTDSSNNVLIGSGAVSSGAAAATGNISLGYRAGVNNALGNHNLVIETNIGATPRAMFAGDLSLGNLVIGNSAVAQRGLVNVPNGAVNIVGLINGAKSATNPTNGGYFYVTAGALHWVGSAGTDTAIAPA